MAKEKLISTNTLLYYHTSIKNLLAEKVDKVTGYSLISDTEITRLSSVVNYDDTAVQSAIATMQGQIGALQAGTYDDTELKNQIAATYATIASLETHATNTEIHVTKTQTDAWDAKLDVDDISELASASDLTTHTGDTDSHVTISEKTTWNAKVSATELNTAISTLESTINGKLTSAMHYKGSVSTFADLPTNPEVGDVYNVETAGVDSDSNAFSAGANAAWNGTKWDMLPGTVDLTNYYNAGDVAQNTDIDTILNS